MSKSKGTTYTFIFATAICIACSLVLAVSATVLQPRQRDNIKLDIVQNILISVGHTHDELIKKTPAQNFEIFDDEFETILIDKTNQKQDRSFMDSELKKLGYEDDMLKGMTPGELVNVFNSKMYLLARKAGKKRAEYDPGYKLVYAYNPTHQKVEAYVIPISGYGLWDVIKGYLALDTDLNTVKGITFYEHKETPGLGARITEDWFKDQFKGKEIIGDNGDLVSITIARGKASDSITGPELIHYVDGISGATLTGKGVNHFLKDNLSTYEPYFAELRNKSTQQGTDL